MWVNIVNWFTLQNASLNEENARCIPETKNISNLLNIELFQKKLNFFLPIYLFTLKIWTFFTFFTKRIDICSIERE